MQIATVHTLSFSIKTDGNDQWQAAQAIIKIGAATLGLSITVSSAPLPENEASTVRSSNVKAVSEDHDRCELYWGEVMRALALIGVEATSP